MLGDAKDARGDLLLLRNGGQIEGTLVSRPAAGSAPDEGAYVVRIDDGITLRVTADRVGRLIEPSDEERQYDKLLSQMPSTVAGHVTMAKWCQTHQLREQKEFHWQQVLVAEPNHAEARRALGYQKVRGEWVRQDEFMKAQGYQLVNGKWKLPQQAAMAERQNQTELAEKKLRKDIRTWRGWFGGRRDEEARQRIRELRDPLAVAGLKDLMDSERDVDVRYLYAETLAKIPTAAAVDALADAALHDPELEVRLKCVDYLKEVGKPRAVALLTQALSSGKTETINRAAEGLARLGDPECVSALLNVLVTYRDVLVAPPPGNVRPSFGGTSDGSGGMNGLSAGGTPQKVTQRVQNKGVLEALIALTGQNYHYSVEDWKTWYVGKNSLPDTVNLRRD